ncbi:MAG TPA: alginate export family protein [Methylomirabilota bacterium]|nr:alginate export family protein [Methylomirabilota bacterium]
MKLVSGTRGSAAVRAALLVAAWSLVGCSLAVHAQAPAAGAPPSSDPNAHQRIPPAFADGQAIELVWVHLLNPTTDAELNESLRRRVADAFAIRPGAAYNQFVSRAAVAAVRRLEFVQAVEERLYSVSGGRQIAVALLVTLHVPEEAPPPAATGAFATGELGDLPMLWQDDRSQLKVIFNPAVGAYADRDPWVGNPGAFVGQPDQSRTTGVVEAGVELGIGGITRVGDSNAYVYGAASYIGSTTLGRDIFNPDSTRVHGEVEDLYAGLLVARKGAGRSFNLSVGRQKFSLNRNLMIGHVLGASNGGDRAASNLSPRNAYDMTVDARLQLGELTLQAWFADPNELPSSDSRSQFAGLNFRYNNNRNLDATLTLLDVPRSDARYPLPDGSFLHREGLRAVNPRIRWTSAFNVPGLWLEGEWAHQWHDDFDMSADAFGGWVGYTLVDAAWRPGFLYRYAVFTGDDPGTDTYERFDSLTGGVQRDWAQGMDMIKIVTNRNLRTHRFEVSVKPMSGLDLSVDYYYFTADTLNNLGGQRAVATYGDDYLGQEITPTLQWMVNRNLYVQSLVSIVIPGRGLKEVLPEPARTWKTFQLSLYWFF